MKKLMIINLLVASTLLQAQSQKLTLKECLELGLKNSKELKIAQSKQSSSAARVSETSSQLLPQLKLQAGYTRLSDVPPFEVKLPISPNPIRLSEVILDNYSLKLSLQQPLFTGFRLTSLRNAAELNTLAAEKDFQKETNEVSFKIYLAFWQLYKCQELLKMFDENVTLISKRLEDTRNFMQNGLATQNDLLKLEVQLSNIKLQRIEAMNSLDIARMVLNQAIGVPLNDRCELEIPEFSSSLISVKPEELISEARTNRKELEALALRYESYRQMHKAAKAGWFPSIYLAGNYYYSNPNQRYQPPKNEFKNTWDVGVMLSWDIWNWGLTSSQSRQAEENMIQSEATLAQVKDAIEIEVYQNYLTMQRAYEKVEVSKAGVEQSKENYRITEEKYKVQLAGSTDLIDAENSLIQARTSYNTALVDFELSKVRLEKALGRKIF